jgi:hypothetical protein
MSNINKNIFLVLGYILAVTGILFRIFSIISSITNYPFTTSWSEAGRIFAAYQVYAPIIAGKYLSFPWLDPGRSILDGMILLIPNLPIWAYRLWVEILFLIFAFLTALVTVQKAINYSQASDKSKIRLRVLLTLWGMLFLLQGPVYYHVLAGVIPILWLYNEKRPLRNLIIIILCSIWEALCRVNWFLMPATVAVLLYVLSTPFPQKKILKYFKWPLVYSLSGGISSFTVYLIFIKVMGFVVPFLNPSMDYAFFLYKLWANTGFIGLLPGIAILSLPVLLIILYAAWKNRKNLHWIRLLIVLCLFGIFFAGSTLVSLRAGGGYDLHNYDTFILLIFISGCFFGMDSVHLDGKGQVEKPLLARNGALLLIILIPFLAAYPKTGIHSYPTDAQSKQVLQEMKQILQEATGTDAEHPVLFIDQRQLLVFHMLEDENIYVPYEKIELMEMAMANNRDYRSKFVNDLKNHRFSLIVSEKMGIWAKHYDPIFFERDWYENTVWVDSVAIPILDYYTPIYYSPIYINLGFAVYAPKE